MIVRRRMKKMKTAWKVAPRRALEVARARSVGSVISLGNHGITGRGGGGRVHVVKTMVKRVPKKRHPMIFRRIFGSVTAGRQVRSPFLRTTTFLVPLRRGPVFGCGYNGSPRVIAWHGSNVDKCLSLSLSLLTSKLSLLSGHEELIGE